MARHVSAANPAPVIHRARYESFGGIISCLDPPFLAWVDREFMRGLGCPESDLWKETVPESFLSGPIEVHCAITGRCSRGCAACYMDARPAPAGELSTAALKASLSLLREMGAFHVALGGGEAFERDDLLDIASHCRSIGLVPNLTTSGLSVGDREIEICRQMGQVNVSCDGVGVQYGINGRTGSFAALDRGIRRLKRAGVALGMNCVVSRRNHPLLAEVVRYASEMGLNEVEFLKWKPSGRGRNGYAESALTQEMIRGFYPMLMTLPRPDSLALKIDCSLVPALLYHRPPRDELEKLCVSGCMGGDFLLSVRSDGVFSGCSFIENPQRESIFELPERWRSSRHLNQFRDLAASAAEPCRSCEYLSLCRCGCRATALFHTGEFSAPDPECPFVFEHSVSAATRDRTREPA